MSLVLKRGSVVSSFRILGRFDSFIYVKRVETILTIFFSLHPQMRTRKDAKRSKGLWGENKNEE